MEVELPPELPKGTEPYYQRHYRSEVLTCEQIKSQVVDYVQQVKSRGDVFHDVDLAEEIAGAVSLLADHASVDKLRHVQAAALYLIDEDDFEGDDSPFGFDDDRQVFNAVALFLERPDLVVDL